LPNVTFQPASSGFEVSAMYLISGTMGSALVHLDKTFPDTLSTALLETTQFIYLITATWVPHTTISEPVPSAAGHTPAIDDLPPDHLLCTASLAD
jgi:hypothetical protein